MKPATKPRPLRESARMLLLDRISGELQDSRISELPNVLRAGDLLVVNDAATFPGSIQAKATSGALVEIRLVQHLGNSDWKAVLMGSGTWRTPTELRDLPEAVHVGSQLNVSQTFSAQVVRIAPESPRVVTLRFSGDAMSMWSGIYAHGKPIQYSYLSQDLPLWSVQTAYASRPWAAEMPSAGYPLAWRILLELRRRGVAIAFLTHAAGLSATGDEDLDVHLPFAERFEIPQTTIDTIEATHGRGGRVIAAGTTVVRALEGCFALNGRLVSGVGQTEVVLDKTFRLRVVDGILTGIHDPAQSHFRLLRAFAGEASLRRAWRHALEAEYLCHEFGDVCLIL